MNRLELFYAPHSRSLGALTLVEELGIDYQLQVLSLAAGDQLQDDYRAINSMGKVPAVRWGETVVTEQAAIFIFLADEFSAAGLAPAIGDPDRGTYLRWMVFYGNCIEPAVLDRSMQREAPPRARSGYADYATVIDTIHQALARGPWLLGERFSAVDVLWGVALGWLTAFGLIEKVPLIAAYLDRFHARPAVARAQAIEAQHVAALAQA